MMNTGRKNFIQNNVLVKFQIVILDANNNLKKKKVKTDKTLTLHYLLTYNTDNNNEVSAVDANVQNLNSVNRILESMVNEVYGEIEKKNKATLGFQKSLMQELETLKTTLISLNELSEKIKSTPEKDEIKNALNKAGSLMDKFGNDLNFFFIRSNNASEMISILKAETEKVIPKISTDSIFQEALFELNVSKIKQIFKEYVIDNLLKMFPTNVVFDKILISFFVPQTDTNIGLKDNLISKATEISVEDFNEKIFTVENLKPIENLQNLSFKFAFNNGQNSNLYYLENGFATINLSLKNDRLKGITIPLIAVPQYYYERYNNIANIEQIMPSKDLQDSVNAILNKTLEPIIIKDDCLSLIPVFLVDKKIEIATQAFISQIVIANNNNLIYFSHRDTIQKAIDQGVIGYEEFDSDDEILSEKELKKETEKNIKKAADKESKDYTKTEGGL